MFPIVYAYPPTTVCVILFFTNRQTRVKTLGLPPLPLTRGGDNDSTYPLSKSYQHTLILTTVCTLG